MKIPGEINFNTKSLFDDFLLCNDSRTSAHDINISHSTDIDIELKTGMLSFCLLVSPIKKVVSLDGIVLFSRRILVINSTQTDLGRSLYSLLEKQESITSLKFMPCVIHLQASSSPMASTSRRCKN